MNMKTKFQKSIESNMTRAEFDQAVIDGQELQKRNPHGSHYHRQGFEIVREANIRFFGQDNLGDYDSF